MDIKITNNKVLQDDLENIVDKYEERFSKLKNATVLITGATGLVGINLVRLLVLFNKKKNYNIKIIAMIRNKNKFRELLGTTYVDEVTIQTICIDIQDKQLLEKVEFEKLDYIIHTASITNSQFMIEKPVDTIMLSIESTYNLLELAKKNKTKNFVYLSSMEAYGQFSKSNLIKEDTLGDIDLELSRSSYPESKRMAELLTKTYGKQYDISTQIARLAQTFGAGADKNDTRVFAQFAWSAIDNNDIVLHTDGLSEGNYCYLSEALSGILFILLFGERYETYNVVNTENHSTVLDMANLVVNNFSENSKVKIDIDGNKNNKYAKNTKMKLDNRKLKSLGWIPEIDLVETYKRLIESFKQ